MGYSLTGLGMARPTEQHLIITRNILINWYFEKGFSKYKVYQEPSVELDTPEKGYVPDIGFYENGLYTASVVIEVDTGADGLSEARTKVPRYLDYYEVEEVFVYDYVTDEWERYTQNGASLTSESDVLGVDLADLIDLPPSLPAQSLSGTPTNPKKPLVML